jgi:hypothetical protein
VRALQRDGARIDQSESRANATGSTPDARRHLYERARSRIRSCSLQKIGHSRATTVSYNP